jgi:2-polyprenyl-6-methoxyphenol hydroxylase-like FAD-dependent oxidoreductase
VPTDEVIVVGAGPTGLALAGELALAGVRCRLLERRPAPSRDSRAICLHARSTEMLDLRGLSARFVAAGLPVPSFPVGPKGAMIDFRRLDSDFAYLLDMPQSQIEDLLEQRARELGVQITRNARVTGVQQGPDETLLTLEDGSVCHAAYVVGCDGLRSTVRESLRVPFPGYPNPGSVALADVFLDGLPMTDTYGEITDTGLLLVFPFRDGSCRVVLYDYARAETPVTEPVGFEEVCGSLIRITGQDFKPRDMYWSSRYRSESRQASSYRVGRVFLAGDAAHTHSPAGAQGLNTGFQDSFNLGWKLAAAVQGRAPDWLLDSYHAERHPVGSDVLRLTGRQFRLNTARTAPRQLLRWAAYHLALPVPAVQSRLARTYSGVAVRYRPRETPAHALEGRRLPRGRLTRPDGSWTRLYDLFHDGRFVLFLRPPAAVPDDLPDRVRVVAYTGSRRPGWPAAVLVRPDGYVAWAGDGHSAATVRQAVREWISGN